MIAAGGHDDIRAAPDELGGQRGQSLVTPLRPAVLDSHVPAFDVARLTQVPVEPGDGAGEFGSGGGVEEPDERRFLELHPRHGGQRERRERGHGFAAPHSITSSARARSAGGMVMPSAFAVLRLKTSSIFVGC